jgi:hypothetical protein
MIPARALLLLSQRHLIGRDDSLGLRVHRAGDRRENPTLRIAVEWSWRRAVRCAG